MGTTNETADKILIDSGTNEVEMLEFRVGKNTYGVNVAKVQSIFQFKIEDVTNLPNSEDSIRRMIKFQDQVIPLISMYDILKVEEMNNGGRQIVILLGFNGIKVAILVKHITEIHRIFWNEFQEIGDYLSTQNGIVVGTFSKKEKEIVVLDFETIMGKYFPETDMEKFEDSAPDTTKLERKDVKVIHADDSATVRTIVKGSLSKSGYENLTSFNNGEDCFNHLVQLKSQIDGDNLKVSDVVDVLILDIEMPKMDGLTLCKKIRRDLGWTDIVIILFSSLIDAQMKEKCKAVGGTTQCSKPEILNLVGLLDDHVLSNQ